MTLVTSSVLNLKWSILAAPFFQPALNEGFFDVDGALKEKLSGIYVSDQRAGVKNRMVPVYFRFPPTGSVDEQFPRIVLDLLSYSPARDREQRSGDLNIPYVPKGYAPREDGRVFTTPEAPIPYNFMYQVTSTSRNYLHDREIQLTMTLPDYLPPRGAYLNCPDGTVRQMFVAEGSPRLDNRLESETGGVAKRLFRSIWTLSVSGELFQRELVAAGIPDHLDLDVNLENA